MWGFGVGYALLLNAAQAQLNSLQSLRNPQDQANHISAALRIFAPRGIGSEKRFWVGIRLSHPDGWHSYWLNPGDAGLPTTVDWTLPDGLQPNPILWPAPRQIALGNLINYGYTHEVLLPVPVDVAPSFNTATFDIGARIQWLACREVCIPESAALTLRVHADGDYTRDKSDFTAAFARIPQDLPSDAMQAAVTSKGLELQFQGLPSEWIHKPLSIYPESSLAIQHEVKPQWRWLDATVRALIPLQRVPTDDVRDLTFVITSDAGPGVFRASSPVKGDWAHLEPMPTRIHDVTVTPGQNVDSGAWFSLLLLAFIGGVVLNLMPCVFPVLALKLFNLSSHTHTVSMRLRLSLAYTAGVVLSMLALGLLMLALRTTGEQLGWGFQLQHPPFVAFLCLLFGLIALHLQGWFDVGQIFPQRWTNLQARRGYVQEFLTGLLSVAVASPCTAPWMAASLGATLLLPAINAAVVFVVLGLGMAMPYWVVCLRPSWVHFLPKSGEWLFRIKTILAYPLWLTAVGLLWVLGQQVGVHAMAVTLVVFLVLTIFLKGLKTQATHSSIYWIWRALVVSIFLVSLYWAWPYWKVSANNGSNRTTDSQAITQDTWLPWSAQLQQDLLQKGQPFFIDFTAAWCITCQFNKVSTLNDQAVLAAFSEKNMQLLRADWTRYDPEITLALNQMGRTGIPVYVLYTGAPESKPVLLNEVLTPAYLLPLLQSVPAIKKP